MRGREEEVRHTERDIDRDQERKKKEQEGRSKIERETRRETEKITLQALKVVVASSRSIFAAATSTRERGDDKERYVKCGRTCSIR